MLDELDDGARIGVWTALGVVAFLLFGLLGGLALKTLHDKRAPAVAAAAAAPAAAVAVEAAELLVEGPLAGDLVATLYFDVGQAALPPDAAAALEAARAAAAAAPERKLVLSGFHDASGDPAKNAELAKERAKSVRAALYAAGVAPGRVALRKPESTTGDGSDREARRVEVRLLPF
ncbi:MAG: OmpA family protein [Proteobacteria bacterium]|nr:OmpA family protein [Pseudomonadota bacterium]